MRAKLIWVVIVVCVGISSCTKKANNQTDQIINYTVKISNKVTEPTIIGGFYGKVMLYEGDFMPKVSEAGSTETKQPEPSQAPILLFPVELKEKIESVKYEEDGKSFYNLRALKNQKVLPKYRYVPNKSGFYQMDLGNKSYCVLLELKGSRGYYNGGIGTLQSQHNVLVELEMRVDYDATF